MGERSSFYTKIAGVTFANPDGHQRQRIITQCRVGEELTLVREPGNPVDQNAVMILRDNGEQLGYIPRRVAAAGLADDLDGGAKVRCFISDLTGGNGKTLGVNIQLFEWSGSSEPGEQKFFAVGSA